MPMYKLVWEIEINAGTPLEAARKALECQRDPGSEPLFLMLLKKTAK